MSRLGGGIAKSDPRPAPNPTGPHAWHAPAIDSNCVLPQRSSQASVSQSTISTASEKVDMLQATEGGTAYRGQLHV